MARRALRTMSDDAFTLLARSTQFTLAQAKKDGAYSAYCAAAHWLEIEQIRERCAELASQSFESVAKGKLHETLGPLTDREREIGLAFARYATHGRTDKP